MDTFPENEVPSSQNIIRITNMLADAANIIRSKGKNAAPADIYNYNMALRYCIEKEIDIKSYGFDETIVADLEKERKKILADAILIGARIYKDLKKTPMSDKVIWDEILFKTILESISEKIKNASFVLKIQLTVEAMVDLSRWAKSERK